MKRKLTGYLQKIILNNFQPHKNTVLELVEGVNIIIGTSDVGKSSIERLVEWVRTNRPQGDTFKHWDADNKDEVSGSIMADNHTVTLKRVGSKNIYELDNESFNTLNGQVPTEISDFLRLDYINMQGQDDKYFLLQDTAGEVAKKLNAIVGLDIIDIATKKANEQVTQGNKDIKQTKNSIGDLKKALADSVYLKDVKIQIDTLKEHIDLYVKQQDRENTLTVIIKNVLESEEVIDELTNWLTIEDSVNEIDDLVYDWENKKKDLLSLMTLIKRIQELKNQVETHSEKARAKKTVKDILGYASQWGTLCKTKLGIVGVLSDIKQSVVLIKELKEEIKHHKNSRKQKLIEYKLCPFCGTELTEDIIEHIEEWI